MLLQAAALEREAAAQRAAEEAAKAAAEQAARLAAAALPLAQPPLCESSTLVASQDAQGGVADNPLQPEPVEKCAVGDLAADGAGVEAASPADDAPAADGVTSEPTMTLGALNEWLAPVQVSAAGLELLGFPVAGRAKAAKLYHEADRPAIVAALVKHLQGLR